LLRKPGTGRGRARGGPAREEGGILHNGQALLVYFGLAGEDDGNGKRSGGPSDAAIIIRNRILDLTLPPGSRIDDRLLMDRFNMGRTPAREAFNRLASEGLIIIERNRGAFVRPLDIQHIQHFFDAYIASERIVGYFCRLDDPTLERDLKEIQRGYLAAYAKERLLQMTQANARLHGRIAVATRNEYVAENALRLYNHARRLSYFSYMLEQDFIPDLRETQAMIKADHDDIIDTVRKKTEGRLVDILSRHAVMFHSRITRVLSKTRGENSPVPVPLQNGRDASARQRPPARKLPGS
jgi:DNA-binding GntR family transcriptional regulator